MPPQNTATSAQVPTDAPIDLSGLRLHTLEQARAELPQPQTPDERAASFADWQKTQQEQWAKEHPIIPPTSRLGQAYAHLKSIVSKHEGQISEKYLAPFREGLDRMADDLQAAAETGHTRTQGQLSYPTRLLAGGISAGLRMVPIGRNVKETAQALAVPPEFPEGKGLSKELKTAQSVEKAVYGETKALPVGAEQFDPKALKGEETHAVYKDNPARQAYHEKVKQEFLSQATPIPANQQPTITVLGGGTASGKTSATRKLLKGETNVVRIDPDEIKTRIPEYEHLKATDPKNAAARVHEESSALSKSILASASKDRKNIILDATTSGTGKVEQIKKLKDQGYKVNLAFVDVPIETAIERANNRALNSVDPINRGRFIPEETIRQTHQGAAQAFFNLKDVADNVELLDNSGATPVTVYRRIGNSSEKVYNEAKYEEYRSKAGLSNRPEQSTGANAGGASEVQGGLEGDVRMAAETSRDRLASVRGASEETRRPDLDRARQVVTPTKNPQPSHPRKPGIVAYRNGRPITVESAKKLGTPK